MEERNDLDKWRFDTENLDEFERGQHNLTNLCQIHFDLVRLRQYRNMSVADVAKAIDEDEAFVDAFEEMDANPDLHSLYSYSLAVGARINAEVIPEEDNRTQSHQSFFETGQVSARPIQEPRHKSALVGTTNF
ncbi:MAG: hypothetical protein Q4P66_09965 [Actinomycetaceae bacterium]|nr:hypothetical protein [Actinomycetaceae bacterium]